MNILSNPLEIAVLLVAALFIFGPDRLPGIISQTVKTLRQLRTMANSARSDLTEAMGPELRELNITAGLEELRGLRDLDPRRIVNNAITGDTYLSNGSNGSNGASGGNGAGSLGANGSGSASSYSVPGGDGAAGAPLTPGQPAPIPVVDPDAT